MDMTQGPLAGKLIRYTIPLILAGILQLCFNAADTIVVGRFAGGEAMAAVGSTGPLNTLIINLFLGLSVGVSVTVAHAWGAKHEEAVSRTVHTAILIAFLAGCFVMLVGFFGCRTFLTWMGSPANVIDLSVLYMRIYFLSMPACMVYNFGAAVLRSIGDTRHPMIFLTIAGVVNVTLNLITVIFFHMGVAGVALATSVSQIVSAVLVVRFLMKQENCCRLDLRRLRIHGDRLAAIVRIGIPSGLQSSVFAISNVLIQSSINSFGSVAMEGNTAAGNLEGFVYIAMNSFYHAALTFVGQNIGAQKYKRILRITVTCILLVSVIGASLGALVYTFRTPLLSIYTSADDPSEMIALGSIRLSVIATTYFLCGIMESLTGVLRAMGASFTSMVISLIGACGTRLIWLYTIFAAHRTLLTLYWSYPVSWTLTLLMQLAALLILYRRFIKAHPVEPSDSPSPETTT